MISQLLADSCQNPISEWQVMVSCIIISIIYHHVIITDIKCTRNVMCLNHPETVSPQPLVCGKIDVHRTGSWCQKGWRCCSKILLLRSWQMDPIFSLLSPALDIFADLTSKVKTALFLNNPASFHKKVWLLGRFLLGHWHGFHLLEKENKVCFLSWMGLHLKMCCMQI